MQQPPSIASQSPANRVHLWVEMMALYIAAPLIMAVFLPASWMFPMLFALTGLGLLLLHRTGTFRWSSLWRGAGTIRWRMVLLFGAFTALACYLVMRAFEPGALFALLAHRPRPLGMILLLYPVLSALPQELYFRPLFFHRYGVLMPSQTIGILVNAGLFSLAHLMYWSWIVAIMTFVGGVIFARSYAVDRNFPQTVLLHALAGNLIFVFGLGLYFYSGNATRPF